MPFHPILQTVEVTLKAERAGNQRRNVIHYYYNLPRPSASEISLLLAAVEASVIEKYEDVVCTGTRWYELVGQDIHAVGGAQVSRAINRLSSNGTQVAPSNVSLCMSKRTNFAGGSNRGRFYFIDAAEDMFNGDDLNPLYNGALTTLANALLTSHVSGRFLPAVASRINGVSTGMTAITWDQVADSQRRRLKGRGP